MYSRTIRIACTALCLLVVAPADIAFACNVDFRAIKAAKVTRADLRRPVERPASRAAWALDDSWTSTWPQLNQVVRMKRARPLHGVYVAAQQALSVDALPPDDYGWTYVHDRDPATPPCGIVGATEWQSPRIFVSEGRTEARITAASQRTPGARTGCVLNQSADTLPCPNLTRTVIRLKAPIGNRRLVFERF